ncbi:alpha/beta fold hydrolase [Halobacteriaceae archaeon GCM10025711]
MSALRETISHGLAEVGDIRLHYVELGGDETDDSSRPLEILLHGFPQYWYAWRHQLEPLAAAGYHVVAPDLRGYNRSDRPASVEAYRMEHHLADLRGLVDHFDPDSVTVVGHDWGGAFVWEAAVRHPDLFDRQVVLNFPHPGPYRRDLLTWRQLKRSWYVGFFLLPGLPETVLEHDDYAFVDRLFRDDPVDPDAFSETDIRRYKRALSRPGALTAAVNYYRALIPQYSRRLLVESVPFVDTGLPPTTSQIDTPTMVIWGEQDSTVVPSMADGLEEWIPDVDVRRLPNASHWVQEDCPDTVTDHLLEFLRRY